MLPWAPFHAQVHKGDRFQLREPARTMRAKASKPHQDARRCSDDVHIGRRGERSCKGRSLTLTYWHMVRPQNERAIASGTARDWSGIFC